MINFNSCNKLSLRQTTRSYGHIFPAIYKHLCSYLSRQDVLILYFSLSKLSCILLLKCINMELQFIRVHCTKRTSKQEANTEAPTGT